MVPGLAAKVEEEWKAGWESELAKRALASSGVRASKRGLARWLFDVRERLASAKADDAAVLLEELQEFLRADFRNRNATEEEIEDHAQALLEAIAVDFLSVIHPSAAINVSHHREMYKLEILETGQEDLESGQDDLRAGQASRGRKG